MGVRFLSADDNAKLLKAFGLSRGVVVGEVITNSPAQIAGMRPEDVILALDGTAVNDLNYILARLSAKPPGTTVRITADREGAPLEFVLTLAPFSEVFPDEAKSEPARTSQPSRPRFGMAIRNLPPAERIARYLEETGGIAVDSVQDSSFAQSLGLQPQDIILSLNRHPISSVEDFLQRQAGLTSGDAVTLRIKRAGPASNSGASGTWSSLVLSGTLPDAPEDVRETTQNVQPQESPLGWYLPRRPGEPVRFLTTDGRILVLDESGNIIGTQPPQQGATGAFEPPRNRPDPGGWQPGYQAAAIDGAILGDWDTADGVLTLGADGRAAISYSSFGLSNRGSYSAAGGQLRFNWTTIMSISKAVQWDCNYKTNGRQLIISCGGSGPSAWQLRRR
jgi:membrane-associated protease RseP (regulator of RpoE activity)